MKAICELLMLIILQHIREKAKVSPVELYSSECYYVTEPRLRILKSQKSGLASICVFPAFLQKEQEKLVVKQHAILPAHKW